ncbi:MAG TPA: PEP-CTERM sorting domain-containing protein [Pirellulales bacterium]|jgi:hypothetical protein
MGIPRFRDTLWVVLAVTAGVLVVLPSAAMADTENVVFTIDPTQSTINLSGNSNNYGNFVPIAPGSDTSSVDGHFLVAFDPLTNTPSTIQFVPNDGYYEQNTSMDLALPGAGVVAGYAGLSWDFNSAPLTGSNGVYTATTTSFTVLTGGYHYTIASSGQTISGSDVGVTDPLSAGTWTLSQSPANSGNWTLGLSAQYTSGLDGGATFGTGTELFKLNAVSTAQFGTGNVATVAPTDTQASALGGSATPGGVSINFGGATNGGTFSAQQIPNSTGLPQQAIIAAQSNPIFAASTADLSLNPQIWSVDYTGLQTGQSATLVFHYDPSLLPAGTDQSTLGIWHFDKTDNAWVFGGTVNTTDHTISFTTSSFSPFELGIKAAPEPASIVMLGLGLAGLVGHRLRRRRS